MGFFNLSCGLTNLSIGAGNRVALYPLVRRRSNGGAEGVVMVSKDGPTVEFIPVALPIYGEYNDYGCLENIEKNKNTEVLEKYFGCEIQTISDFFCFPCERGHRKFPETLKKVPRASAMMVHRDIADRMKGNLPGEFGDPGAAYFDSFLSPSILKRAGFVAGEKDETRERYNIRYTHPKVKDLIVWSDNDNFCKVFFGDKHIQCIFHLSSIENEMVKRKIKVPKSMLAMKKSGVSSAEVEYDAELTSIIRFSAMSAYSSSNPEYAEYMNPEKFEALLSTDSEKAKEVMNVIFGMAADHIRSFSRFFTFGEYYGDDKIPSMIDIYGNTLVDPFIRSEIVGHINTNLNMFKVNQYFHPCGFGPQCGIREAEKQFLDATMNLHKKLSKRRKG